MANVLRALPFVVKPQLLSKDLSWPTSRRLSSWGKSVVAKDSLDLDMVVRLLSSSGHPIMIGMTSNPYSPVPTSVFEAAVEVAGKAFYWKNPLLQLLSNAGVDRNLLEAHREDNKFTMIRQIWGAMDARGSEGRAIQRKIVTELANLEKPLQDAPDQDGGKVAIQELKRLALEYRVLISPEEHERKKRRGQHQMKQEQLHLKELRQQSLLLAFRELGNNGNKQQRGYAFEKFLGDLFRWAEIDYNPPVKTEIDQIDGSVIFESFTYLIEAKWRDGPANWQDLQKLKGNIKIRLSSTRGLFISESGFQESAITRGRLSEENPLILMDGLDLVLILENRISLRDAFAEKINAATMRGNPYLQIKDLL